MIPLKYMPLTLELELVSDYNDAIVVNQEGDRWSLSDVQVKCDLVELDNSLNNEYASKLLSGGSIPINFSTFSHTAMQTGGDKYFAIN
eukprot:2810767-Heterocapsa_arctica.AAC.1